MSKQAPLVPPEVDLTSLEYMPLYLAKLRSSRAWLFCHHKPELAYYLINLWTRAWQERPAGSLEADDVVLCDAARANTMERWLELKKDLLRGWVLCSDGRYYLPSMVPMIQAGWATVQGKRKRAKAGADARWNKPQASLEDAASMPSEDARKHPSKDASMVPMEGRKEGRKEGIGGVTRPKNGSHPHPRQAFLDLCTSLRHGTPPAEPITAKVVEAMGGFDRLKGKGDTALLDLRGDFEARYTEALASWH